MKKGKKPGYLKNQAKQPGSGGSPVRNVSDANFEKEVIQSDIPVFVDFWAPWCGPCKMVGPVVEDLAREYDGRMKFVKLNTQDNQFVPSQMGIRSIPTLVIFKGADVAEFKVGAAPREDLKRMIDRVLEGKKKKGVLSRIFG